MKRFLTLLICLVVALPGLAQEQPQMARPFSFMRIEGAMGYPIATFNHHHLTWANERASLMISTPIYWGMELGLIGDMTVTHLPFVPSGENIQYNRDYTQWGLSLGLNWEKWMSLTNNQRLSWRFYMSIGYSQFLLRGDKIGERRNAFPEAFTQDRLHGVSTTIDVTAKYTIDVLYVGIGLFMDNKFYKGQIGLTPKTENGWSQTAAFGPQIVLGLTLH